MGEVSFRLRLAAPVAKFVRKSQFGPARGALRQGFVGWLENFFLFEGRNNRRNRDCNFLYYWGSGIHTAGGFGGLKLYTRTPATAAKFGILPVFHLANRAKKNQDFLVAASTTVNHSRFSLYECVTRKNLRLMLYLRRS